MKLYRSFLTVGGLTMVSRVLGFIRDVLIGASLGSGPIADAFFTAFRFPNLFRRIFAEGAFNAAFVPMFAKRHESDGAARAGTLAEEALAGLLFVLLIFSGLAMLAMPWLMYVIAPGFADDPGKFNLTILLTQIAFPYLLFMSLVALLSGVLNSVRRFTAAAAAPILLNLVLSGGAAAILVFDVCDVRAATAKTVCTAPAAGYILAWSVALAGALQLVALAIATRRAGFKFRLVRPRWSPDMRQLLALGIPGAIAGSITQINIVIGGIIASLQDGAVSYLYYADRLYQVPLGVVGAAVGVVMLPDVARKLRAGDAAAVMNSQNRSLEFALLITVPAAIGLAVCAVPITRILFERGAFTPADTSASAAALAAFAVGLPCFVLQKVLQPAYFAREDTATPMRFAWINLFVNAGLSLILFFALQAFGAWPHVGIAIATSVAGIVNAWLLWRTLQQRGDFMLDAPARRSVAVILATGAALAAALVLAMTVLAPWLTREASVLARLLGLGALVGLGLLALAISAELTGIYRVTRLWSRLRGA
jgi:putative peptidoglycan lipid II flippase